MLTQLIGYRGKVMAKIFAYIDKDLDFKITHEAGEFILRIESMNALDMARQFRKISDYFKSVSRDKTISKLRLSVNEPRKLCAVSLPPTLKGMEKNG